jgi:hypothetical protein
MPPALIAVDELAEWSPWMPFDDVEQGRPLRAKAWGQAAFARANLHVCWAITGDRRSAFELERAVLTALNHGDLWNRAHPASST